MGEAMTELCGTCSGELDNIIKKCKICGDQPKLTVIICNNCGTTEELENEYDSG